MNKGNEDQTDFRQLNDRVKAEEPKGPFLAIKTNMDTAGVKDDPYSSEKANPEQEEKLQQFFEDEEL
ncbi:hypothetical protein FGG79_13570 [Bacillus sp. BHET2]|uniref:hypothetical protein n=1 Tax=Bacillus sp. BHET2 TaxID=2583818 RepID=UPI00110D5152|nr:hypothetical protein [Bacillus sp. BHET2]TMU84930.1 hypothetical protein FGG79_13570 [Bacillus sp. BHET2]